MRNFRDLSVWQKAHALTLAIYKVTKTFPREELFGLTSQMRRSSSSIAANIAEGCGRRTDADFARFLQNAFGSASELEYHITLAGDLGFINGDDTDRLSEDVVEVKKMLAAFLRKLNANR
ncbi:MAG: four helix bundle protein [Bacteroidota bacterium]